MGLGDNLKSEKAKERYDRNFNSVETTYSQKELEEHDTEIRAKAIDEFAERLKSDEFQKYNLDMVFETSRDLSYSNCINAFCEYIDKIAEEMRGAS